MTRASGPWPLISTNSGVEVIENEQLVALSQWFPWWWLPVRGIIYPSLLPGMTESGHRQWSEIPEPLMSGVVTRKFFRFHLQMRRWIPAGIPDRKNQRHVPWSHLVISFARKRGNFFPWQILNLTASSLEKRRRPFTFGLVPYRWFLSYEHDVTFVQVFRKAWY